MDWGELCVRVQPARGSQDEGSPISTLMDEKKINPEIDTTKFVNIDDKKFVFYINNQPREVEAGEEKIWPVYVCQHGAKHLVDRILQEKHNIKDTLRDSELRRSLFAQILPQMAEQREIKPLSEEDFRKKVEEELKRQQAVIDSFGKVQKETEEKVDEKDAKIKELEEKVNLLLKKKVAKK